MGEVSGAVFGFDLYLNVRLHLLEALHRAAVLAFGLMPKRDAEGVRVILERNFLPLQSIAEINR